ncbi:MAG: glycosyltransferase [Clostridiales bacterium]|nr:glycosyltransferase [Clostridiales bacterium]
MDFVDALSLNMLERAEVSPTPLKSFLKIESNLIRRYEEDLLKLIDKGFVISLRDKLYLGQVNKIKLIPNGVDLDRFPYLWEPKNEGYIVFLGRMNYPPNEDAVSYFVEQILPIIQKKRPETRFLIVGADPSRKVRTLSRKARGVQVLGFVPDVVPYLKAASVFVAPLRRATGLQNKVLEAMAVGVPVIASPKVVQGLGEESSTCLLTAENADDFAEKTLTILSDPVLSLKLSRAAREFVQERFDWKLIGKALIDELLS